MKARKTRRISMWIDEKIDRKLIELKEAGADIPESDLLRKIMHAGLAEFEGGGKKRGTKRAIN